MKLLIAPRLPSQSQYYLPQDRKKTSPNFLFTVKNKTLYVKLSSSVLREELSYGKEKIIKMINEEMGKEVVTKLVLR